MHILMLFSTSVPVCEGIASHVMGLSRRLRERGHEVTLMTRGRWRGKSEFEYEGFEVRTVPFCPLYPFHVHFHARFVKNAIEALVPQPDLINLHTPLVPALPKNWPLVTTFHTPMLVDTAHIENIGLRTFLIRLMGKTTSCWIEKKLLKVSDAVITVSHGVADELKTYYDYKGAVYPIPNVVDTEFYKPAGHFPDKKKLLYVGRLAYRKGLFEVVESALQVIKKHPDVRYVLVGSGPLEKPLREAVGKRRLESSFEFCGEIRDPNMILKHYHEAYAVLIPSHYEGLPMTLLEAMACGKAIITTNASFSKGILANGTNALLVNPKSVDQLEQATIKLLSSEQLCKDLGKSARKTVVEKMSPETNTDKIEEVYNNAINKFATAVG